MHIPDGFLDGRTVVTASVLAAGGVGTAIRSLPRDPAGRQAPLLGLTGAFVFAAQMLNFPVAAGTSGHLLGATLAAALLGPAAAVVVMTSVVVLQCFLFNDGGLLALGANVLNLAVVAPVAGWLVLRAVTGRGGALRRRILGVAFASWCSVVVAALPCAGELAWSGTVAARLVLPAMTGVHLLIGLGEAVIAALVVAAIARTSPELLDRASPPLRRGPLGLVALLVATALAVFLSPFASALPDGLEWAADRLGFAGRALPSAWPAPLSGADAGGLAPSVGGTVIAALAGTVVAFGLSWLLARVLTRGEAVPARK